MKRFILIFLAAILLVPATVAHAAMPWIEEARSGFCYYKDFYLNDDVEDYFWDVGRLQPGGQIRLYIDESSFYWDDYSSSTRPLSMTQAQEQGLSVGYEISGETNVVASVGLARYGGAATVLINLSEQYNGSRNAYFSVSLHLLRDGELLDFTDVEIDGIVRPGIISVDRTMQLVDASRGAVMYPGEGCSPKIYAGNGFNIKAPLQAGNEYQAKSVAAAGYTDNTFYKMYNLPEISYLYTYGFAQGGKYVTIDTPYVLDVYGDNDRYIGTTADSLPIQKTYRLAERAPEPDKTDEPDNVVMGGGADNPIGGNAESEVQAPPEAQPHWSSIISLPPQNFPNYNPATGR